MERSRKVLLSITPMTPIRCRAPDCIHSDIQLKALSVFTTFKSKQQSLHSPYLATLQAFYIPGHWTMTSKIVSGVVVPLVPE
jgi:hypothetical protein